MTLKVHHLRPAPGSKTAKTRVGRGEGSKGKTAGRRYQGYKGSLSGSGSLRGWPNATSHAYSKAKGIQESIWN
jgi:large subunit ribosomal protein L15